MKEIESLLETIDIKVNGNRPWDIKINNPRVWDRILSDWSLGLGESYMDGDWDCDRLDIFFEKILSAKFDQDVIGFAKLKLIIYSFRAKIFNLQSVKRAFQVGEQHYNLGNDLYEKMLDPYMQYSCAYWGHDAKNLNEAQEHKLEMICKKLQLKPGDTVLEIGCGWGELAHYMEKQYGVNVTGLTVSIEQKKYFEQKYPNSNVKILLKDYRDTLNWAPEQFDKIVSVGMFEHVGSKNYKDFFSIVHHNMKNDGITLLHTIGKNDEYTTDKWIEKYIFPNGELPNVNNIIKFKDKLLLDDWHNFGKDYNLTLIAWQNNFKNAWPELKNKYDDRFYRMWVYYLNVCAAAFYVRNILLWQLILTKKEKKEQYRSFRY